MGREPQMQTCLTNGWMPVTESLPHPFHAFSGQALLNLVYAKDPFCSKAIGLGFESQSSFLSLDHISHSCLAHCDGQNLEV